MIRLIQIDDNNPKAKAFLEIAEALGFKTLNQSEEIMLSNIQIVAIEKSKKSLEENGGTTHEKVMENMSKKYPHIFRS